MFQVFFHLLFLGVGVAFGFAWALSQNVESWLLKDERIDAEGRLLYTGSGIAYAMGEMLVNGSNANAIRQTPMGADVYRRFAREIDTTTDEIATSNLSTKTMSADSTYTPSQVPMFLYNSDQQQTQTPYVPVPTTTAPTTSPQLNAPQQQKMNSDTKISIPQTLFVNPNHALVQGSSRIKPLLKPVVSDRLIDLKVNPLDNNNQNNKYISTR